MIKGGNIDVTPKGKGKGKGGGDGPGSVGKGPYYLDRGVPSHAPHHNNDSWHRRRSTVSQQQHDARQHEADQDGDSGVARYYQKGLNAQFIAESVEVTNIYDTARNFWLQVGNVVDLDTILWGIEVREPRTKLMTGRVFCRLDSAQMAEK